MNLKTVVILLVLALATIFALVCVLLTRGVKRTSCESQSLSSQEAKHSDQSLVFADLTPEEMVQVVSYLQENLGVPLVDASHANPSDNCIYYIDVQLPTKAEVLAFLDRGGRQPQRQALAVVYFGNQPDPNVTEYVVSPLPKPTSCRDITVRKYGGKLPYHRRPVTEKEYKDIEVFVLQELSKASNLLRECCDYDRTKFAILTTAPRGFQSGDRATWFVLFQDVYGSGYYLHPVGLEVLVDHKSLDVAQWRISKVFYNGQYYENMEQLDSKFIKGHVEDVKVKQVQPEDTFGSMRPRIAPKTPGPLQCEPHGPRYSIQNNHVTFQSWSFAFGMDVNTGPRLFDIRFNGERIVYELSLQEALAVYGSNCPGGMVSRYMDGSFGIGRFAFELVRGVDCPYTATYVDRHYLVESETPKVHKNSLCIFEQDTSVPLRRHYSNLQSLYYGGLAKYALVLRAISTIINYDYVWDFIFYQNGAIEVKIHATGYISSSFLYDTGTEHGNQIGEHTLGTMHTHLINYKVDLDVGGRSLCMCSLSLPPSLLPVHCEEADPALWCSWYWCSPLPIKLAGGGSITVWQKNSLEQPDEIRKPPGSASSRKTSNLGGLADCVPYLGRHCHPGGRRKVLALNMGAINLNACGNKKLQQNHSILPVGACVNSAQIRGHCM
uniref:Amine oxidase n=1 Tax=Pelusios castaneus TaxID=367368 RepID=A0A8C8S8F4_9SAUR